MQQEPFSPPSPDEPTHSAIVWENSRNDQKVPILRKSINSDSLMLVGKCGQPHFRLSAPGMAPCPPAPIFFKKKQISVCVSSYPSIGGGHPSEDWLSSFLYSCFEQEVPQGKCCVSMHGPWCQLQNETGVLVENSPSKLSPEGEDTNHENRLFWNSEE